MATQDTAELLAQLKDIHLPPAPAAPELWPLALSGGLCILLVITLLLRKMRNRHSWHSQALHKLGQLKQLPGNEALPHIAALLKQIVLTHDNQVSIRQLHGEPWLRYLDQFFNTDYFTSGHGRVFGQALYQQNHKADAGIYKALRKLIKRRGRQR